MLVSYFAGFVCDGVVVVVVVMVGARWERYSQGQTCRRNAQSPGVCYTLQRGALVDDNAVCNVTPTCLDSFVRQIEDRGCRSIDFS